MFDLPIFPLNTVLFPGMPLHLRIFEERYRQMVSRCQEQHEPFGVALIRSGQEAGGPPARPHTVGTTARILRVEPAGDGTLNLTAMGDERFRISQLSGDRPYLMGRVEILPLEAPHGLELQILARSFTPSVKEYLHLVRELHPAGPDLSQITLPQETHLLLYLSAALLQVPPSEKQALLAALSAADMLHLLVRLYRRENTLLRRSIAAGDAQSRRAWLN